jgi:two-component system, OmpR family, KDP operon response regulator KdpE
LRASIANEFCVTVRSGASHPHAGKVLTHRFLLKELWDEMTDARYLRVYVRSLRQKIETDPERPQFVLTETGIGYRLKAQD